jgi:mono/diheme cytochrome c family protein
VVATFQPITVAVPVYGVGYAQDNTDIINELRALRQEMQALRALPQVERKEALQQLPKGLQVLQTRCAGCHDAVSAKGKGGGMELFNAVGTFVDVGETHSKILEQINSDHMPKGKEKLTAQEKYDLLWYLTVKEVKK